MQMTDEYTDILTSRENMFMLLARLYKTEADAALLNAIKKTDVAGGIEGELQKGYELIASYLRKPVLDPVTDLAVDYASVFLGAGKFETDQSAYPYESVYTSDKKLIMQEARDEVVEEYRTQGVDADAKLNIPEDHLFLEMEFMAYLCRLTIKASEAGDMEKTEALLKKQKNFAEKHLQNWVPAFCADVVRVSETDFYKGVAKITESYISMDIEMINDHLKRFC